MPFEELKYRALTGLFEMAGSFISSQFTKPDFEEQEKNITEYYDSVKVIARKEESEQAKQRKRAIPEIEPTSELETEKVEGGTACLPCSRDHFSTVAGALSEAIRFGRKEGVTHREVQRRLGIALDELNICERVDLSPEQLVQLKGKEKELADWGLNKSRELRHKITAIQTPDDLEKVAAEASKIRTEFMRNLWSIATVDGSIDKLCKGLNEKEKERCITTINAILVEKKQTPP